MRLLSNWRKRRAERIAEAEQATERTKRLHRAVSPLIDEAHQVASWSKERIERNHLAELFMQGRR